MEDVKNWVVDYSHDDGRSGTVSVTTEIRKSGGFQYGNGKAGKITVEGYERFYDLRYCREKDLHMVMLEEYFGNGLVKAVEQ